MRSNFCAWLLCCLITLSVSIPCDAQVPEDKQSVVAFDLQVGVIRSGELFKKALGDELLTEMFPKNMSNLDILKIDRVIGSCGYPANFDAVMNAQFDRKVPMELFVRMQLTDAETAAAMYQEMKSNTAEEFIVERNGQTYLYPGNNGDVDNISVCKINDNSLGASDGPLFQSKDTKLSDTHAHKTLGASYRSIRSELRLTARRQKPSSKKHWR